jgi:hypothetical protein
VGDEAPRRDAVAAVAAPTARDLSDATAVAMPPLQEGGYFCEIAQQLRCSRDGPPSRFQCTYRARGAIRRTTVQWIGAAERERHLTPWRWIGGWKWCAILY